MRLLVMLSVCSLLLASASLPPCDETSSPLDITFPPKGGEFMECWTFQCKGTVHMTVLNFSASGMLSLVNNGYQLTSLREYHDNYAASYPANGEMTILYYDTPAYHDSSNRNYFYVPVHLIVEWECDEDTPVVTSVVPPALGPRRGNSSAYLTLAQSGTYERLFSQRRDYNWFIPCTGTLSIAEQVGNLASAVLTYINSNGSTVFQETGYTSPSSNEYEVSGDFLIQLTADGYHNHNNFFFLSWSCNGVRPELPSLEETAVPATRAPPTNAPMPACEETSSPLNASFFENAYQYMKCWTFQCKGTVHMTFLNFSAQGMLSLLNKDGYQLTSLMDYHDNYTASYPANGEMMILYRDTDRYYHYDTVNFVVEWECDEDTPVVPPAEGYDSLYFLTLTQSGTYERLFSASRSCKWIIPCTGTLSIAEQVGNIARAEITYLNSNGSLVFQQSGYSIQSSNEYEVRGDFSIMLRPRYNLNRDDFFLFSWSCNGVRPVLTPAPATRAPVPTPLPATPTPPTYSPLPPCEQTSSPLDAAFDSPNSYSFMKCWTFQCQGTVHMAFSSLASYQGVLSLVNSNGYQLTSLTRYHDSYTASYPANGEMMILYNESNSYFIRHPVNFVVEWECDEDTPVVPPAEDYDTSDYLTLAQTGTYRRQFSEARVYNWIIPCTGTLSIAEQVGHIEYATSLTYFNSNGVTVLQEYNSSSSSNEYEVRGDFLIQLSTSYDEYRDNSLLLSWSCEGPPLTNSPVYSFAPTTYLPDTPTTTPDHPAGSTVAPTDLPSTQLPATDLPAGTSFSPVPNTLAPGTTAPPTSAPPTATTPTELPSTQLPATDQPADTSFAPVPNTLVPRTTALSTSAPPTALPTATPTDLPAGATFAPPPPPSVNALCTTDEDCRLGRLDPKSTCEDGTCVCHTQGYGHPPGVPLCLLADDVTVPMAFAVEYDGVEAQSLWTTATKRESFEDTMGEALGTVTDMRVVVSDGGVLVVGMVRASTAKLADALSGKEDLSAALSSSGVSVSHGVTCARTDASYTVQHNGVCNAVECEGNTTLTLADGTYRCEREAPPQPEEAGSGSGSGSESGVSSKVFLYVGIGVGVLAVAVGVVVAFCCLHKKQHAKEPECPLCDVLVPQRSDDFAL